MDNEYFINCLHIFFDLFVCSTDALRTQPYDLLSWSAAYFRCIADDVEPPTKARYEDTNQLPMQSLTVEYLKVLVKQVLSTFLHIFGRCNEI